MLGRLTRSEDFERVLGQSACARSLHFSLHFLAAEVSRPGHARRERHGHGAPLDKALEVPLSASHWGWVVPKRHARRAVTRSLIKRQFKSVVAELHRTQPPGFVPGLWVLRMKSPIDTEAFPSAASRPLAQALRQELLDLLRPRANGQAPVLRRRG